ncbi:unnamed protein product [Blepharisma stoltei]|uniref:Cyclin-like domain-containing protein n=1 Tax=Blepharisma stoltei TaxID=1481888 RepID=A0AAU9JZW9_9CILI|nr:unnamed protein product [Blepharisma stoltei]
MDKFIIKTSDLDTSSTDYKYDKDFLSQLICEEHLEIYEPAALCNNYLTHNTNEKSYISNDQDSNSDIISDLYCDEDMNSCEELNNDHTLEEKTFVKPQIISPSLYFKEVREKELLYLPDPEALKTIQGYISPKMRTILIGWMMEVAATFSVHKETLYMAISHLDRFISAYPDIETGIFQLVGLSTVLIAMKAEEIMVPQFSELLKTTDNAYNASELSNMEKTILKTLKWKIYPPTAFSCLNFLLSEWDKFIISTYGSIENSIVLSKDENERQNQSDFFNLILITYKQNNQASIRRLCEVNQFLDFAALDCEMLKFKPSEAALGVFYLMIQKAFNESDYGLLRYCGNGYQFEEFDGGSLTHNILEYFFSSVLDVGPIDLIYSSYQYFLQLAPNIRFTDESVIK